MKEIFLLSLFTLFALAVPCESHSHDAVAIGSAVDAAAQAGMADGQVISLAIGIIKDGKTYTYNYGTTERGSNQKPTVHTRYAIASITKTFTGILLADAVVEKKVKLDDDVRKYLDGDYPNLEYQGQPIRLYQLIDHTSGLPRNFPDTPDAPTDLDPAKSVSQDQAALDHYTREDFFRDLRKVTLIRIPGTKFSYSNAAAQLLGTVLEHIYGMSYQDLLQTKILKPLKMRDTTVTLTDAEKAALPKAFSASGSFFPALSDRLPAAACLKTTTSDMLKYLAWNMAEKDPSVKISHQPPPGSAVWSNDGSFTVGLNWQIIKSGGLRSIFQDGYVPGFHSMCVFCPELNVGIVVLSNEEIRATPTALSPLVNRILKVVEPRMVAAP